MLRTGKQVWEASAKKSAMDFRMQELGFHVDRFTTLATQASVLSGFAFEGLVHMEPPEHSPRYIVLGFWLSGSLCMMFSLYVLIVGSIACILGYQLALLGADGDCMERAVQVLRNRRCSVFTAASLALASLCYSAGCMCYLKMGEAGPPVAIAFAVFSFALTWSLCGLFGLFGRKPLTTGATQIYTGNGYFDLASLNPGINGHVPLAENS